jgi:hypothetical protein
MRRLHTPTVRSTRTRDSANEKSLGSSPKVQQTLTSARKLVMSVNPVKTHVGHIYTKLGITSRAQLAAILTRIEYSNE